MHTLCRDCRAVHAGDEMTFCAACGGGRLVSHAELESLAIAHLDCDSFYASVEKNEDPALRDRPVLVGGRRRGVVMAACYVARRYGVHSAMPMFKALRACPEAVVIAPDMAKYSRVGRQIRTMMREVTPLVEPISIDEAFLDLAGTERLHGGSPARTMAALAAEIESRHGIPVSVGLSCNKFLAKLASGLDKPRGFRIIGRAEAVSVLATLPVERIWGVGAVMQKRLARDGLMTIGQLQAVAETELVRRYGELGLRLARLSRGEDARAVDPETERKSVSSETTFDTDISDPGRLERILWRRAEAVSASLKREGIGGRTVTLKLKTAKFAIRTRSRTLSHPTQMADVIYATARHLLRREAGGERFRLLGVGLSDLASADVCDPFDLADPDLARRKKIENVVDDLRERFGGDAIAKGRTLEP